MYSDETWCEHHGGCVNL